MTWLTDATDFLIPFAPYLAVGLAGAAVLVFLAVVIGEVQQ